MRISAEMDDALLRGAVALTPNHRTARALTGAFDRRRQESGLLTWASPTVLQWDAWARSVWLGFVVAGRVDRLLLNPQQELSLWQQIVCEGLAAAPGNDRDRARLCVSASRLLHDYRAGDRLRIQNGAASEDVRIFTGWLQRFEGRCRRERLLPPAALPGALAEILSREGKGSLAAEYLLFGFDRLTPAQAHLISSIEAMGSSVQSVDAYGGVMPKAPLLLSADSETGELLACAEWIRDRLREDPQRSIAVVVPDLPESAAEVDRLLRRELRTLTDGPADRVERLTIHMAEGQPLNDLPMAAGALRLLRWCAGPLGLNEIGALLRSPYLALVADPERGAELDAFTLRAGKRRRPELSMAEAAAEILRQPEQARSQIYRLAERATTLAGERTFATWAETARQLLKEAGWPGIRERTSGEFQIAKRWEEMLDRTATLDLVHGPVGYRAFLTQLDLCCAEALFAPENTGAAVQVMSVTEAAGTTADALWFLHGTEPAWSSQRSLHPLLPWRLQREFGMPGADLDADGQHAAAVTERLARSAREVCFSYAAASMDGPQRPSGLILQLAHLRRATSVLPLRAELPIELERFEDETTLPALPDRVLRGGVSVLQLQAACGFRAFAEKRLFSTDVPERTLGMDPRDRGELVHKALELFWRRMQTQTALKQSMREHAEGESGRDVLLQRCVDDAFGTGQQSAWETSYVAVQRRRLFTLLRRWLDHEAERPPFVIQELEYDVKDARVGPLRLQMRVDRIDRTGHGDNTSLVLIDYKTSDVSPKLWQGERPDEPQLLAYAVAAGLDGVEGIAFGSVRVGKHNLRLKGWAADPSVVGGWTGQVDFAEQMPEWRRVVEGLARQFAEGDASVDPKMYPKTCQHCGQRLLCRLDTAALLATEDEALLVEEETA